MRTATLLVEVVDLEAAPGRALQWMELEAFAARVEEARPRWVSLSGRPDVLSHPGLPALVARAVRSRVRCDLRTDATRLDPGRAWALLGAGLSRLTLVVTRPPLEARGARNLERLVAMRDANRKPTPVVRVEWWLDPAAPSGWADAMARWGERLPEAPPLLRLSSPPFGEEQARRVRLELLATRRHAAALRLRATVASVDRLLAGKPPARSGGRAPGAVLAVRVDGTAVPGHSELRAAPMGAASGPCLRG